MLLQVVFAADPEHERKIQDVNDVLAEIHADHLPQILLYNKIDLLPEAEQNAGCLRNHSGRITAVRLSATQAQGLDDLRQALLKTLKYHLNL